MGHEKKLGRRGKAGAVCAAAALSLSLSLTGCAASAQSDDNLPETHLDDENAVSLSHERCGGCHIDGQRGSEYFEKIDRTSNTDLSYGREEPKRLD